MNCEDVADITGLNQATDHAVVAACSLDMVNCELNPVAVAGLNHRIAFSERERHWFLAKHVDTVLSCCDGGWSVKRSVCCYKNDIWVGLLVQLIP